MVIDPNDPPESSVLNDRKAPFVFVWGRFHRYFFVFPRFGMVIVHFINFNSLHLRAIFRGPPPPVFYVISSSIWILQLVAAERLTSFRPDPGQAGLPD